MRLVVGLHKLPEHLAVLFTASDFILETKRTV